MKFFFLKNCDLPLPKNGDFTRKTFLKKKFSGYLEGGHADPAALVPEKVDEDGRELRLAHSRRAHARHRHEDVRARLAHAPHTVLA